MIFFRAELEREAGGRIFNAAEGTETRNQVCKQFFSRSMVINLLGRWKILATMDLPSHPARLAHVGLLATRQVLLSNRAQALEQRAPLQLWTRTTWWRRMVASGFGPRPARNGSGRLRQEPTRFVLCIIVLHISAIVLRQNFLTSSIYFFSFRLMQLLKTLAHQTLVGRCCQTERGLARRPPGRPTLKPARGAGNLEVLALALFCLEEEESTATREATTLGGSPNQMERW